MLTTEGLLIYLIIAFFFGAFVGWSSAFQKIASRQDEEIKQLKEKCIEANGHWTCRYCGHENAVVGDCIKCSKM